MRFQVNSYDGCAIVKVVWKEGKLFQNTMKEKTCATIMYFDIQVEAA